MNEILEFLYEDLAVRYIHSSPYYREALEEFNENEGLKWVRVFDGAAHLAFCQGYASFLLGLHLGLAQGRDLTVLTDSEVYPFPPAAK